MMERHECEIGDCVQLVGLPADHSLAAHYAEVLTAPVQSGEDWLLGVRLIPSAATGYVALQHLRWVGEASIVRSVLLQQTGRETWAPEHQLVEAPPAGHDLLSGLVVAGLGASDEPASRPSEASVPSEVSDVPSESETSTGGASSGAGASAVWDEEAPSVAPSGSDDGTEDSTTVTVDESAQPRAGS